MQQPTEKPLKVVNLFPWFLHLLLLLLGSLPADISILYILKALIVAK